ncbi:hypothetical protein NMY22_g354 [Coprinellus aureogranulatus]|nr:hypothetical protein NMY22_g354 [Coprinellus aureogranulatus]
MDQMVYLNAILLPSDGRPPSLVELMLSPMAHPSNPASYANPPAFMPHPEVFMDYIAEIGARAWKYQVSLKSRALCFPCKCASRLINSACIPKLVEALDGMNKKFANPYIIFYPTVSRDGMPFPVNKCIKDIQGKAFKEPHAWRGNIVIAKYRDDPFTSMIDASMADFAILKNFLLTHGCPHKA